jgi:hypothetical protein
VDLEDFSVEHINGLEPIAQEFRPMPPAGTTRPASTEGRDSGDPQSVPHAWQNIISAAGWISVTTLSGSVSVYILILVLIRGRV